MVLFPRSPPRLMKPISRVASFYALLGTLSVLLWVLVSYRSNSGLPTNPRFLSLKDIRHIASSYNTYTPLQAKKSREPAVSFYAASDIINALRSVTAGAGSGPENGLFDEEEEYQWHMENLCKSRWELPIMYASRNVAGDLAPNPAWDEVFAEYATMHRTCMSQAGNITVHFLNRNSSSTGCKFLVVELPKVGLGNKILFKASAMLFAVLTQRVILIPDNITDQFCEPFVGSSWKLKDDLSQVRNYQSDVWHSRSEFQLWVDKTEYKNPTQLDDFHAVDFADKFQPLDRYYCDTEQAYMSKVPWISMSGCSYFLPKLFAIPAFRLALEDMFPDRMALTQILRTVFLPSNDIWERINDINDLYLQHTQSLVGVQLRYLRHDLPQNNKKMNDLVNWRVLQCVTSNKLLPAALPVGEFKDYVDPHQRNTSSKVFIASRFPGLHDYLSQIYVKGRKATGEGVGLVQQTHEREEEVDVEAFVEIICLSLSDALLVTPVSTFRGLAQAYGALRPWLINVDDDGGPACERAQSVDVCFYRATETFICPHDPDVHGSSILDSVPYIQKCKDSHGVQLITDHESNYPTYLHPSNENSLQNT